LPEFKGALLPRSFGRKEASLHLLRATPLIISRDSNDYQDRRIQRVDVIKEEGEPTLAFDVRTREIMMTIFHNAN
jgi:hypothetical protein